MEMIDTQRYKVLLTCDSLFGNLHKANAVVLGVEKAMRRGAACEPKTRMLEITAGHAVYETRVMREHKEQ